MTFQTMRAL